MENTSPNIKFFDAVISEPGFKDLNCECRFIEGKDKNIIVIFQGFSSLERVDDFIQRLQIFLDETSAEKDNILIKLIKSVKNKFGKDKTLITEVLYEEKPAELFFGYKPEQSITGDEYYGLVYSDNGEFKKSRPFSKKGLANYAGCDESLIDLPRTDN